MKRQKYNGIPGEPHTYILSLQIFPMFNRHDVCIFVFRHMEWFWMVVKPTLPPPSLKCDLSAQASVSRAALRLYCFSVLVVRQRCRGQGFEKVEER